MLFLLVAKVVLVSFIFINLPNLDTDVPKAMEKSFNTTDRTAFHALEKSVCNILANKIITPIHKYILRYITSVTELVMHVLTSHENIDY